MTSLLRVGSCGGGGDDGGDGGIGSDGDKREMIVRPRWIVGAKTVPQGVGVARGRIVECIDDMIMLLMLLITARYNPKCTGRGTRSSTGKYNQHNRRHILFYF